MLDNLRTWTYPLDGLPGIILGRDWVLANASLYSLTASGGSSAYVGYAQAGGWGAPPANSGIPTAAIQFAHDLGDRQPRRPSSPTGCNYEISMGGFEPPTFGL
jgi:hypothetical protein